MYLGIHRYDQHMPGIALSLSGQMAEYEGFYKICARGLGTTVLPWQHNWWYQLCFILHYLCANVHLILTHNNWAIVHLNIHKTNMPYDVTISAESAIRLSHIFSWFWHLLNLYKVLELEKVSRNVNCIASYFLMLFQMKQYTISDPIHMIQNAKLVF